MSIFAWIGFLAVMITMLAIDLGVFHRKAHVISAKEALRWTGICILIALCFNVVIYFLYEYHWLGMGLGRVSIASGKEAAKVFFTAWLVEQSLSLDNIFVIALIFAYFRVPLEYQHRVLFWGILGAVIMRGAMIAMGATLLMRFEWLEYLFGGLLIYAGIKMLSIDEESVEPEKNVFYRIAIKLYPVSKDFDGTRFFTVVDGKKMMTPLFLVLLVVESTDVVFAVDSIPAVFGITKDPFIVFTSNIFAILNLRSLYFALSALMGKFRFLNISLLFVLLFVGVKMIIHDFYSISVDLSFSVIVGLLVTGVVASIFYPEKKETSVDPNK